MFIINFFEYTLSGWLYFIWLILMLIFSLACLGVVGEKVSKKRLQELAEKRKQEAEEEYEKAHELVERQIQKAGVDIVYDPTAEGAKEAEDSYQVRIMDISNATNIEHDEPKTNTDTNNGTNAAGDNVTSDSQDNQNDKAPVQEVVDLDKVASPSPVTNAETNNSVNNSTEVNATPTNTSSTTNVSVPVSDATTPTPETDSTPKEQAPAVLVINDDGTSNV